jgi:DDE superfamily endonuclease/Helix-turn-helix of DDE superfamily endonuclease
MIARYYNLRRYPSVFLALTGLRVGEFDQLTKDMAPMHARAQQERHTLSITAARTFKHRERAVGGGCPPILKAQDQLLLTVVWLRKYPTNEVLGFLFGVSDSVVSRLVRRWAPLLAQAGTDGMRMPDPGRKHRRQLGELLSELPELGVVIDSFEQPVQRPCTRQEADKWYSGKKRRHTIKSQVGVDRNSGEIVDVSESVKGPTNDLTLLKSSKLLEKLPQGVSGEGDLAYVGIASLHPQGLGFTPRRKPRGRDKHRPRGQDRERPVQDIAYNRAFARSRIVVENSLCRMRRYECLWQTDRHHRQAHSERVAAVAGLVNRQIRHRLPFLAH